MNRTSAAALRRAKRIMRTAGLSTAARSMQKAMLAVLVSSTLSPAKPLTKIPKSLPKAGHSLGQTVRKLRAAQASKPGAKGRAAAPRIPEGAQWLARTHRSTTGSRRYRLYLPASRPTRPAGLILMLHGCRQTPEDFALGTHMNALAEKHGLAVAYPEQTGSDNAAACWNWFRPGDQLRGAGEPALLAALTRA